MLSPSFIKRATGGHKRGPTGQAIEIPVTNRPPKALDCESSSARASQYHHQQWDGEDMFGTSEHLYGQKQKKCTEVKGYEMQM
jgi:hypothetical protein